MAILEKVEVSDMYEKGLVTEPYLSDLAPNRVFLDRVTIHCKASSCVLTPLPLSKVSCLLLRAWSFFRQGY